jgi:hypothetical protein
MGWIRRHRRLECARLLRQGPAPGRGGAKAGPRATG